jgi:hypothetical protein
MCKYDNNILGPDSVVGIEIGYRIDGQGSNPGVGVYFCTRLDGLCSPSSFWTSACYKNATWLSP